jgi:hypothetical protein
MTDNRRLHRRHHSQRQHRDLNQNLNATSGNVFSLASKIQPSKAWLQKSSTNQMRDDPLALREILNQF